MKAFTAGMLFGLVASTTAAFAASSVAHDGTFLDQTDPRFQSQLGRRLLQCDAPKRGEGR
jgi:hypothetical protein